MRFYVAYCIWNKGAHIPWICQGIATSMPKDSIIDFTFENCTDKSLKNFQKYGLDILKGFEVRYSTSEKSYRWPNVNDAIKRFMDSDCDLFLSPQDDMKLQDKKLTQNLIKLYQENPDVGIVGMRDGFDQDNKQFSSNHSHGPENTYWLNQGEYKHVIYVNDGPVCLNKYTIEKVGLFNTELKAHFGDNDYCFRANKEGLRNFVIGAEIVHEKWGCKVCGEVQQSEVWDKEISDHDWAIYRRLYPDK